MKHIAFIVPSLDRIGGAQRQLLLLARGFCARGWRVTVVVLSGHASAAAKELAAAEIPLLCLYMRCGLADLRGWHWFHLWLRRERPDILHAHLPSAALFARWSRLAAPVRVVTDRLHTTAIGSLRRRFGYWVSSWLSDCVTAVSWPVANSHRIAGMVPASRLLVLPNGVDVDAWAPDPLVRRMVRVALGLREDEFLWLAAGRLALVKDYPTLLNAFARLPSNARLIIAGDGPQLDELRAVAACLDLQSRVRFHGFEPNPHLLMQAADGLVLSSLWEGLPTVLLEAAASGLPAIATDIPGTRPLASLVAGPLAPATDSAALAASMRILMETPAVERHRLGQLARDQVAAQYSLDAALDRWESLYGQLLAASPQPRRCACPASSALAPQPEMRTNG